MFIILWEMQFDAQIFPFWLEIPFVNDFWFNVFLQKFECLKILTCGDAVNYSIIVLWTLWHLIFQLVNISFVQYLKKIC